MLCALTNREEVVEGYLSGSLAPQERDSFEEHYFGCDECFATLQAHRALQVELSADSAQIRAISPPKSTFWRWPVAIATAAIVIVAALGVRWSMKKDSTPTAPPTQAMQASPPGASLAELARFDPPAYSPAVMRGAQDEATRKFGTAMKQYQQGRYDLAVPGLRQAAKLNPEDPGSAFFLGVSESLSGNTDGGITALQKCIALGDTPYVEEAHYYLAKAYLRNGDLTAATKELQAVVQLKGSLLNKAQELLQMIQSGPSVAR